MAKKMAVVLGAVAILSIGGAGVAQAGPGAQEAQGARATQVSVADVDAAKRCLHTRLNDDGVRDRLRVANRCNHAVRAKVILANAPDFRCAGFPANTYRIYKWNFPGRFDGVERC